MMSKILDLLGRLKAMAVYFYYRIIGATMMAELPAISNIEYLLMKRNRHQVSLSAESEKAIQLWASTKTLREIKDMCSMPESQPLANYSLGCWKINEAIELIARDHVEAKWKLEEEKGAQA